MLAYQFSIIIPAYNEQAVIENTLNNLLADDELTNVEIIVVCNGCIDSTYEKVTALANNNKSSYQQKKICLKTYDIKKASKTNALNIGIENASSSINVLFDADIMMSGLDVVMLVNELKQYRCLAISPKIEFDYSNSGFWCKQYYRVAQLSSYNKTARLSNVIALDAVGTNKITPLPEVIADDEYIRQQFKPSQIKISKQCYYRFVCPKTLTSLLQVLTRVERGNIQLRKQLFKNVRKIHHYQGGFSKINANVFSFKFIIFSFIKLICKTRARIQIIRGYVTQWERDESNRGDF